MGIAARLAFDDHRVIDHPAQRPRFCQTGWRERIFDDVYASFSTKDLQMLLVMRSLDIGIRHGDHPGQLPDFILIIGHQKTTFKDGKVDVIGSSFQLIQDKLGKLARLFAQGWRHQRFLHGIGVAAIAAPIGIDGCDLIAEVAQTPHDKDACRAARHRHKCLHGLPSPCGSGSADQRLSC